MALIQTSLIWVAYAVAIALLLIISAVFVYLYQTPRDRATSVTIVCTFTMLSLLATVLLLPVDVALVSSTTRSSEGRKKDWATPEKVDSILYTLKIVYYTLFSLDAVLCLLVAPFTYFFFEEYDEVAAEEGSQTIVSRFFGAMKYTIVFVLLCVILFLVGFFVPIAKIGEGQKHMDLDYFKKLLSENRKSRQYTNYYLNHMLTSHRRRESLDFRPWPPDHYRHNHIHHLHCFGAGLASSQAYQIRTSNLSSVTGRQHSFSTRTEP